MIYNRFIKIYYKTVHNFYNMKKNSHVEIKYLKSYLL